MKKRKFGSCCYCGQTLTVETFSREHVLPKSRNGSNKKVNKLPCCKKCNQDKGNKTIDEYITYLTERQPVNYEFKIMMCQRVLSLY
jgi:5-methylcytosine-specific restriction protein A